MSGFRPPSVHNHGLTYMHIARIASPVQMQLRIAILDEEVRSRLVTRLATAHGNEIDLSAFSTSMFVVVSKMIPKVVVDPIEPSSAHVIM